MNKFWPKNSPGFHLFPHQVITTRERGDIPGCTPAPRSGIYRPQPIETVRRALDARADRVIREIDGMPSNPNFRGTSFIEPLFGAYGEQL